jgi:hypothetical protein
VSQRRSSPCGLFSGAEDKVKLSDNEIEEAFTSSAAVCRALLHRLRSALGVLRTNRRIQVLQTRSAIHLRERRNAFRRDVRLQSRSFASENQRLTENAQLHGCFSSQSFWKRGSLRRGSNIGSSLSSAGVSGTREANGPSYGIESNFVKAVMERS